MVRSESRVLQGGGEETRGVVGGVLCQAGAAHITSDKIFHYKLTLTPKYDEIMKDVEPRLQEREAEGED